MCHFQGMSRGCFQASPCGPSLPVENDEPLMKSLEQSSAPASELLRNRDLPHPYRFRGGQGLIGFLLSLLIFFLLSEGTLFAEQRFPPPDFETTGHKIPDTATPAARAIVLEYLDVAVLAASLGIA